MKPNLKAAIDFLKQFRPGGPWVLTAITPDGPISTTTFAEDRLEALEKWLRARVGKDNIYFQVNSSGTERLHKKALKSDIKAAEWLHVDVDPTTDDPELFAADRKRLVKKLKDHVPAPNLIIDSGGGYQGFWKLTDPVKASDWAEFECYNRQIETDLGGDHCHNVDRIMRLPGTINMPNKKKREKGRKEALTKVVTFQDTSFDLEAFGKAPMIDGGESGDVGRIQVDISGNLPVIADIHETLKDKAEEVVKDEVIMLIVQGHDPENPDRWPSRSECFWYVVCELVRCGVPDEYIASIILDQDFMIAHHVLDQRNPQGYATRQIQRAHEFAENENLPGFNDSHFVTWVGGKLRIVKEQFDEKGHRNMTYFDKTNWISYYDNDYIQIGVNQNNDPVYKQRAKWWFEHPRRRSYEGVVFQPGGQVAANRYNLWRGFSCAAVAGENHLPYLDHIRENLCGEDEELYNYLLNWMARVVQTPGTQSETAVVLRGKEGTGKNTFVEVLGSLFPEHYFEASQSEQVVGKFNAHLRDKVLVHANEAFFAGDKKHEGELKALITESTRAIEAKGIDITQEPNYVHLVMSSNERWVVPAGPESRRFFVLDVSDAHIQDGAYFAKIRAAIADNGREHLLRFLLDRDLSGFNVRSVPKTKALIEQRQLTMSPEGEWWFNCLDRGYIKAQSDGWMRHISTEDVQDSYIESMDRAKVNRRSSEMKLARFLMEFEGVTKGRQRVGAARVRLFEFPELSDLRDQFDMRFGGPFEWTPIEADIQGDIPF